MIPIPPFDGSAVKDWSKPLWIILTAALLLMLIVGYFVIPNVV
jgi:Zn-dependent protease